MLAVSKFSLSSFFSTSSRNNLSARSAKRATSARVSRRIPPYRRKGLRDDQSRRPVKIVKTARLHPGTEGGPYSGWPRFCYFNPGIATISCALPEMACVEYHSEFDPLKRTHPSSWPYKLRLKNPKRTVNRPSRRRLPRTCGTHFAVGVIWKPTSI